MSMQNLVSASLSDEDKAKVQQAILVIKSSLGFLTSLKSEEVRGLFKAGNGYAPLLDKAYTVMNEHPEILPPVFDAKEFRKDYRLYKEFGPLAMQIAELAEAVQNTMIALASDTMLETLEIYQSVKLNKNKIAGLSATAEDMSKFFLHSHNKGKSQGPRNSD